MSAIEELFGSVLDTVNDETRPIYADENSASRDASLATGTNGLRVALAEYLDNPSLFPAGLQQQTDIFSFNSSELNQGIVQSNEIGDIFTGFSNRIWTSLCLGKIPEVSKAVGKEHGQVDRPGVAHGALIREFCSWVNDRLFAHVFTPSESNFISGGWCNGVAGALSIEASVRQLSEVMQSDSFRSPQKIEDLLNWASDAIDRGDLSLCHGAAGALVVVSGIARASRNEVLLAQVNDLFDKKLLMKPRFPDLRESYIDLSWLTGSAGILWAAAVLRRKPHVNPLLPFDSLLWESKR